MGNRAGRVNPIDWHAFLKIGAPLGALVGLFNAISPVAELLIFLPASVFVAVHLYLRRQPAPLRASQGAKLGAMIGLLTFAIQMVLFVALIVHDPAAYRRAVEDQIHQALANAPDPQAKEMVETFLHKADLVFILTAVGLPFALGVLLGIGAISGAVAVSLQRNRSGP